MSFPPPKGLIPTDHLEIQVRLENFSRAPVSFKVLPLFSIHKIHPCSAACRVPWKQLLRRIAQSPSILRCEEKTVFLDCPTGLHVWETREGSRSPANDTDSALFV